MKYNVNAFTGYDGEVYDTYQDSKYCKKTVYIHPIDHVFYYRSTPYKSSTGFIGDDDGVYSPWWTPGSSTSYLHAEGDMDRHILFPTTIVNMGSRNQCIQEICLDPEFSTDCSVTDQIGSTTFQDITDLVSDIYNIKMDKNNLVLRSFFQRPEKEIGGDVAQALMQNSMLGVYGYESNDGDTQCECNMAVTTTAANMGMLEYPLPCNTLVGTACPSYTQYAINITGNDYNIEWEPLMYTAATPIIMAGADLWSCITMDLSASSQTAPFYPWMVEGGFFGTYKNDWAGTIGDYIYPVQNNLGFNLGGAVMATNIWVGSGGPWGIYAGDMQYYMSLIGGGPPGLPEPLGPWGNGTQEVNFSRPLFFYFGLRPGRTSYNTFIRKYIDEELAGTVI